MSAIIDSPAMGEFKLSVGEIHYLYWYIQGSIMFPEIRRDLRKAWGFCERHAWGPLLDILGIEDREGIPNSGSIP